MPPTGLLAQNGHLVRREDSRSSLFTDPGTLDSMEVRTSLVTINLLAKMQRILN